MLQMNCLSVEETDATKNLLRNIESIVLHKVELASYDAHPTSERLVLMDRLTKNVINAKFEKDLVKINISLTIKRKHIWKIVVLILCVLAVFLLFPNEDWKKYLLEIMLKALQYSWVNRNN